MKRFRRRLKQIRLKLGISLEGFDNEEQALDWYRRHYKKSKGEPFFGTFGFRFDPSDRTKLLFDSSWDPIARRFSVSQIPPIDKENPLDREVLKLGQNARIDLALVPALRLVVLVGSEYDFFPTVANYMFVPLGAFQLIVQPHGPLSEENRKRLLKDANHPGKLFRTEFDKNLYRTPSPYRQAPYNSVRTDRRTL